MTRAVAVAADVDCWAAKVAAAAVVVCWAAKKAVAAAVVDCWAAKVAVAEIAAAVATNANQPAAAADCFRADDNVAADVAVAVEKVDVHVCLHLLLRVHRHLAIVHPHRHLAIVHLNHVVVARLVVVVDVEAAEESYPKFSPVNVAVAIAAVVDVASRPTRAAVRRLPNANGGQ